MKNLLFLVFLFVSVTATLKAAVPEAEKQALIAFYNSTNGSEWTNKWNLESDVSKWHGVKVINNHVAEINLFRNNLSGTIPASIGNLKSLTSLNLAFNSLTGELPKEDQGYFNEM